MDSNVLIQPDNVQSQLDNAQVQSDNAQSQPDDVQQQPFVKEGEIRKHTVNRKVMSRPWMIWWYTLTAPLTPSEKATLAEREQVRKGRLVSTIICFLTLFTVISLLTTISNFNILLLIALGGSIVCNGVALFCNRHGYVLIAGLLVTCSSAAAFAINILALPGGLDVSHLLYFEMLVVLEIAAVSLLPAFSVFLVALANSLFVWAALSVLPHDLAISYLLIQSGYTMIEIPVMIHFTIAVIVYLWARSTQKALVQADQTTEVMHLQRALLQKDDIIAHHKKQLDFAVQQIDKTHQQIAKGDLKARVALSDSNILWSISGKLNNLLSRFQSASEAEQELQRTKIAIMQVVAVLQRKEHGHKISYSKTGTMVDAITAELQFH